MPHAGSTASNAAHESSQCHFLAPTHTHTFTCSFVGFALVLDGTGAVKANVASSSVRLEVTSTLPPILDAQWHQVAMVFGRNAATTAANLTLYVDGVLAAPTVTASAMGTISTAFPVVMGQDGTLGFTTGSHLGTSLDEVGVQRSHQHLALH